MTTYYSYGFRYNADETNEQIKESVNATDNFNKMLIDAKNIWKNSQLTAREIASIYTSLLPNGQFMSETAILV